jgi:hypothetical protein
MLSHRNWSLSTNDFTNNDFIRLAVVFESQLLPSAGEVTPLGGKQL